MANSITLAKAYTNLLDEVYRNASVTNDLISDNALVRAGANANEILYPQISVSGLGDYDRNSGYTNGSVSVVWKTATFNYDRGSKISVDSMDDEETFGIAFGQASSTLMTDKVAPEGDAFTFATLAGIPGISKAAATTYTDASEFLAALIAAQNRMDEDEVPMENRFLFITPTLLGMVQDLDTTKSREVLARFTQVIAVPQTRFYTAIAQKSGKIIVSGEAPSQTTTDETAGGYTKASGGKDINFMIVHKSAVIQFPKHIAPKVITPEQNQTADAWKFGYRQVGVADVYENKTAGIYVHHKA